MIIQSIELQNFRNYESLTLLPDPGTNIFYGDNAQGKTNLLEAAFYCGTSKSHKRSKDKELIRFGEQEAHIRMSVKKDEVPFRIDMHLKKNQAKGIAINGIPIKKASELFGIVNFVFFSPEGLNIIKRGPEERRRFMNMELSQIDKIYMSHLSRYLKILANRNKLLKDIYFQPELKETLAVWNLQMEEYGIHLMKAREEFVSMLNELAPKIHKTLSGGKEELTLIYEPNVSKEQFLETLEKNIEKDLKMKTSTCGPHKDDICFLLNGVDIRRFGSQGQQRTAALSLKLAEIELMKKITGDQPILLLDDVLSELDSSRQNYILGCISQIQTFITCTGLEDFVRNRFQVNKVFFVENGTISPHVENIIEKFGDNF